MDNRQPLKAARYYAGRDSSGRYGVWMDDTEGNSDYVQQARPNTYEAASKAAQRWQEKENASVARENARRAKD